MDVLGNMFPDIPLDDLEMALEESHQDIEMAIQFLLAMPIHVPQQVEPDSAEIQQRKRHETTDLSPAPPQRMSPLSLPLESDEGSEIDTEQVADKPHATQGRKALSQDEVVASLLPLFPDACLEFLKKQYKDNYALHGLDVVEFLADKFIEGGYTRAQRIAQKRKREPENDIEKPGHNYEALDRAQETEEYCRTIRGLLVQEFPRMPVTFLEKTLRENRYFLAVAYPRLLEAHRKVETHSEAPPYKRLGAPRKASRHPPTMNNCWARISNELDYAKGQAELQEMERQIQRDAELAAKLNEQEYEESKMLMECQCCFCDVAFDNMTHCGEGEHFFCLDCARKNAENEIGNSRYKLLCMDSSGCNAEFSQTEVRRFLEEKSIMALSKLQQEEALRVADIVGLVQCPFCDYAAICRPIEEDKEFRCQNPDCMEISCRHCEKKSHIPLSCKEASKDDSITARHAVEEAMTEAMIRKCKKCKNPFIKDYGCNKMVCTKPGCGSIQCYVCSQTVNGYEHFNDKSRGGNAGNCPLFDNVEERHETEIQRAAEAAKERLRQEHPELTNEDLDIHLSEAVKRREQERRQAAQPAHLRYNHRQNHRDRPFAPPPPLPPPAAPLVPVVPLAPINRERVVLRHGRQPAAQPAPVALPQIDAAAMPLAVPGQIPGYQYMLGRLGLGQLQNEILHHWVGVQHPPLIHQPYIYQAAPMGVAPPAAPTVGPQAQARAPHNDIIPKHSLRQRPPPPSPPRPLPPWANINKR